jgi:hypothetical protein
LMEGSSSLKPSSYPPVWAETSQLLIGIWEFFPEIIERVVELSATPLSVET